MLDCRLVKAEQLISENRYKIYEVAEMVGYHDLSYFIRVFKKKYGVMPNVYRRISRDKYPPGAENRKNVYT